jgi:hypothetical protein
MLVMDNWKMIKEKVVREIEEQNSKVVALASFEV